MPVSLPLNENDDVRAVTCNCGIFASRLSSSSEMPSEKYSCSLSLLMFTNGSTAIECAAIDMLSASPLNPAPLCQTNVFVSSSTTATTRTPMIQRSNFLPECAAIDCAGSIWLSRFNPSGVNSKNQANAVQ